MTRHKPESLRILIATTTSDRPEVAIYKGLVESGFEVTLIGSPGAREHESLTQGGVKVIPLTIRHRLDLPAVRRVRQILKQGRYHLFYAPRNGTLSVCLLASWGMPIKRVGYRGTSGHLSHFDPASWLTYLNPNVDRLICVSEAVRHYLLSMHRPPERLVTIHKGHDPTWYSDPTPASLAEFHIPSDAFVVGFTGNMRPVKGIDVLIQSALALPSTPPIHFLLVGEVRDKRIMKWASDERIRHRFHFAGFRADAAALAGACNVFVMPSVEREGLPRSVIEAMAQGITPIVTDVGGMPELVVDNECGLIVPPRDPSALAHAIVGLARDPARCRDLGEKARIRIQTHFHIRTTIEKTVELFRDVATLPSRTVSPRTP